MSRFSVISLFLLLLLITFSYSEATPAVTRPARPNILKRKNPSYHPLSSSSLSKLTTLTPLTSIDHRSSSSLLSRLLIPRAVGSSNLTSLQNLLIKEFDSLGWTTTVDEFTASTPVGPRTFKNLVFTHDPAASRRLVLAAHLDSKYYPTHPEDQFVGATDSAAPVAMLVDLAEALTPWLGERRDRVMKQGGEVGGEGSGQGETLQIVLFDGEEAFQDWTDTDSIYGARHLAELWSEPMHPPTASRPVPVTPLSRISHLILLDLLGSPAPTINSFYPSTGWLFDHFSHSESLLAASGFLWPETVQSAEQYDNLQTATNRKERKFFSKRVGGAFVGGGIGDDHLPFLARGVPVVHLIAAPFPRVWHTLQDDASALDYDTVRAWCLIVRLTVAEYLGLDPELEEGTEGLQAKVERGRNELITNERRRTPAPARPTPPISSPTRRPSLPRSPKPNLPMATLLCPTCLTYTKVEYDPASGVEACTQCGTVTSNSSSAGLEFLGRTLETQGGMDGRTFLADGGVAGGTTLQAGVRGRGWGMREEKSAAYQEGRRAELERYIQSVLAHFNLEGLTPRARNLFGQTRKLARVQWGSKANLIGVACVYIAAREREKDLRLAELADITEFDYNLLGRAQTHVKTWLKITTSEEDPMIMIDKQLAHLCSLSIVSPSPTPNSKRSSSTPSTSTSTSASSSSNSTVKISQFIKHPSNPAWLSSLLPSQVPQIRSLALSLHTMCNSLHLFSNRNPDAVSIGLLLVSLEGIARRAPGALNEISDELCSLFPGSRKFTVLERYRDVQRMLGDYVGKIPWLKDSVGSGAGKMSKGKEKKEIIRWTEDVVKFWKSVGGKKKEEKEEGKRLKILSREEVAARKEADKRNRMEMEDGEEDQEYPEGEEPQDTNEDEDERDVAEDDNAGLEEFVEELSKRAPAVTQPPPGDGEERVELPQAAQKPTRKDRPAAYMRKPTQAIRRANTIQQASSSLLAPFISSAAAAAASTNPPSSPSTNRASCDTTDEDDSASTSTRLLKDSTKKHPKSLAPHSFETVQYRKLLLAGYEESFLQNRSSFNATSHEISNPVPQTRLDQILKTRLNESEIADEELFGEGELEGYIRNEEEVEKRENLLKRTGKLKDWPEFVQLDEEGMKYWREEQKEKREQEEKEKEKRRRKKDEKGAFGKLLGPFRGMRSKDAKRILNGGGEGSDDEGDSEGGTPGEGTGRKRKRKNGKSREDTVESSLDGYESFRATKKSKIDQSVRERLARLFADEEGAGDADEGAGLINPVTGEVEVDEEEGEEDGGSDDAEEE